ncbi:MAG: hypothetical protein A2487_06575 [Candidatus Raymondbacteria bacterium RifOxyC12_full_50_8]|uniref:Secretion system C-terminal sorting domain-containing protein n=1 Tax=Candidatus Raymondbacteria bacterium RIFOXYD12_FULL_49_13 TaxID=1817890 RepID=A0A1F7FI72_UNCRA|nr:MAG: hypothetical protein A2248_21290 [Candidatus Raymondbacteria bacterium RIFOXYA2_FULL_49_16]OGK02154.1 MAG: hypothetical protein A2350_20155 [Candidatus Raymondbacteria bacterium RifOxyB12_full_50_8]OGK05965.1 MAG: hypothetical protein A2487_06575 [Candidatus Raymondbacteria bacterium RifOxyC12_full_50_8]OGK06323.1 MAG: hypothetical protein A2519_08605 [Candidatus Raymondbacteria bacterium RIFOXYD12_FULL_49_13]OGP40656.1 MAG: hypothetical protein A2324_03360 [Candidatus Raymondbacteria b
MRKIFLMFFCLSMLSGLAFSQNNTKQLLKGRYLNVVGGFDVPNVRIDNMNLIWSRLQIDKLPGTNTWAISHPSGYVLELIEPESLGVVGEPWPAMTEGRRQAAFTSVDKISPQGVFWLNQNELLTSGRRSYRGPFEPNWMARINIQTGEEILYTITSEENEEGPNFHMMQGLGAGFVRISDTAWAATYANGNAFLLGRGGYDVLGSPLGPALGVWNIDEPHARYLLDFPMDHPLRRDPYYTYAGGEAQQLLMWKDPDSNGGFWQAGDVGGLAFINHPQVKGIVATHNHGRGLHDYRAQGDGGSGSFFLVLDPAVFYSTESSGGNRGDHESDTSLAHYPKGVYARVGHIFDPDHLAEVAQGTRQPWECPSERFEWPRAGIEWNEQDRPTLLGAVYWDNERQLLWLALGMPVVKLVAYEIVVDDSRPEEPMRLPESWLDNEKNLVQADITADDVIQVTPNPFNPSTVITINAASAPQLRIYNIQGTCVASFHPGAIASGDTYSSLHGNAQIKTAYTWRAAGQASGLYIVHAVVHKRVYTKRIIFEK